MNGTWEFVLPLCLFLAWTAPTRGDPFFFTDRGTFRAHSTGLQTIDFEGLVPAGQCSQGMSSLAVGGVNFQAVVGQLFKVDGAYYPPFYDWGTGAGLVNNGSPNELRVDLPEGTTAAGLNVMTFGPSARPVSLTLPTGESSSLWTPDHPNQGFLGFVSEVPVPYFTLRTEGVTGTVVDNFTLGEATSVPARTPEPASLVYLVGAGLVGLGWRCRRMRTGPG